MFAYKFIASGVMAAAITATAAMAQDAFTKFGEVEGWKVFIDNSKGTCLVESKDEDGNVIQMGVNADKTMGYFGVFTNQPTDIKSGVTETILVDIDGKLFEGPATTMKGNITPGYSGGYILGNNPEFINDIARKYVMTVHPGTEREFKVDLKGTYKALEMAKECNAAQGS